MSLTLLIPGLLSPPEAARGRQHRLPAAEKWLARADVEREAGSGDAWLLRQWGLGAEAPIAALSRAGEGLPCAGRWLRADPIHQQVIRHATLLHGDWALALTRDEADQAIAALNRFFEADRLVFHAPHPGRWYVAIGDRKPPRTTPLAELAGTNPFGHLPEGDERAFWRRVFGEAQMLLNQLPLNVEREAQGRATLNGVWLWGGGELPVSLPRPFARVYANTPLARGLACGPDTVSDTARIEDIEAGPGETLVVIDTIEQPALAGDADGWVQAADAVDRGWFDGLPAVIGRHERVRIVLPCATDTVVCCLTRRLVRRFWRAPRTLAHHARDRHPPR